MKRYRFYILFCTLILCAIPAFVSAAIKLPALVADNMVLQRNSRIPVWGWASPEAAIKIVFKGKTYRSVTAKNGKWFLYLDKQSAGGPYEMHISGDGDTLTLRNILVGDVWICSGQSNMELAFNELRPRTLYAMEIAQSANDHIRQILVPRITSSVPLSDFKTAGWLPASPANLLYYSVVGYFFAKNIFDKYHIPVGIINTSFGGSTLEAWTSSAGLKRFPQFGAGIVKEFARLQHRPTSLFNAMVAPLIPYAIKGVVWYQGESNAARAFEYRTIFPNMIQDWRAAWKQGNFPFIFEQLVNFQKPLAQPAESDWAELREAQLMTLSISPNTGMAVGIDLGEAADIHPVRKKEIGYRLSLAALAHAYGERIAGGEGPFYRSMRTAQGKIILDFDTKGSKLTTRDGKDLQAFSIAGEDKKFFWAHAIIRNNKIEVWSELVPSPVAVRYAWANNPEDCNLINTQGLPASPFRTDQWAGITVGKPAGEFLKRKFPATTGDTVGYRILYPENYDPGKRYPLLCFLHGAGERGKDNERQIMTGGLIDLFMNATNRKKFPCIAIFPQVREDQYLANVDINSKTTPYSFHFNYKQKMTPAMQSVMELVRSVVSKEPVDTNRLYIMGLSMGAIGAFEIVYRFPGVFAGAVAICGAGDSSAYTSCTAKTAFQLYHGDADPVVGVGESRSMYRRLTDLKGKVQLTIYPGVAHPAWRNALPSPDLFPLLFANSRKRTPCAPISNVTKVNRIDHK